MTISPRRAGGIDRQTREEGHARTRESMGGRADRAGGMWEGKGGENMDNDTTQNLSYFLNSLLRVSCDPMIGCCVYEVVLWDAFFKLRVLLYLEAHL